jgi:hypothetical protein
MSIPSDGGSSDHSRQPLAADVKGIFVAAAADQPDVASAV